MKIAQVAPLFESVPPRYYGGTERIVSYLTEELVRQGHEVTLFASGDSVTKARLIPQCPQSLRLDEKSVDHLAHHLLMLEQLYRMADEFDIVHFHIDYLHYPLSRCCGLTNVTTLHGRLDIVDLLPLYQEYQDMPVISISDAQRLPLSLANWLGTVHHGLPLDIYPSGNGKGGYLAFLGRVSPEKGLKNAIEIASQCGMPLKIAAKVDKGDRDYFETEIRPLLGRPLIEFVGEIGESEKREFLGDAWGLLFPIEWEEPFGLVMIESMACGTPVIAFGRGSVAEVMRHGTSGFVVTDISEGIEAVKQLDTISREGCRNYFEERFSAARMAADYVALYEAIIGSVKEKKVKLVMN